jgi:hypothetical protein
VVLDPSILALMLGSILVSLMLIYASSFGIRILRSWDISSGSELQLVLERRTYLISTILSYAFAFQLLSLFLFIYTADDLCKLFVGAMCAAGTLKVNNFGYPALAFKIFNFIASGAWLIMNYADNRAHDYPLTRIKYRLLLVIVPFILCETIIQGMYFLELHPNVITSCCGALFSTEETGVGAGLASFPTIPMKIIFYSALSALIANGIYFYREGGKSGYLFSLLSAVMFILSVEALISFISLYFYELPTHHCPFCILQGEYGHIGYLLYALLLAGSVSGVGIGALMPFRRKGSLENILPGILRKLTLISMTAYFIFGIIATYQIIFSNLKLEGY